MSYKNISCDMCSNVILCNNIGIWQHLQFLSEIKENNT